jgi:hypothetical protein
MALNWPGDGRPIELESCARMDQLSQHRDDRQDAFREGLFVRALGRASSTNPYIANSDENVLWEKGWRSIDEMAATSSAVPATKLVPNFVPDRPLPVSSATPLARCIEVILAVAIAGLILAILIALSKTI